MVADYPKADAALDFKEEALDIERVIAAIVAIRARRAEMNIAPSKKAKLYIVTKYTDTFTRTAKILEKLASTSEVALVDAYEADDAIQIVTDGGRFFIPMSDVIDFEKEKIRLNSELERMLGEISRIEKKLANEGFVAKAPAAVVEGEKAKLKKYTEAKEALLLALAKLG